MLWVIEDAHWIDPTTLELIELALDRVQSTRVLVLITARPTFVVPFASHPVVTRLALNRLARAATQAIVARIARGKRLPEPLLDEIAARTDGVPLFVEEMTKAVIESGVLRESADAYHLDGPLSALAIPTTLHDSLMARLDRLQPVKEVAQIAAVIGRSFDHRTIAALAALPEASSPKRCANWSMPSWCFAAARRRTPPISSSTPWSATPPMRACSRPSASPCMLVCSTCWRKAATRLRRSRRSMPRRLAFAERALDYWEQAGTQALARPAYKEAIANLENGVRLCRAVGQELQWKRREQGLHLQIGQALIANQGYQAPATLRAFDRAMVLADEIGDVSLQLPAAYTGKPGGGDWSVIYNCAPIEQFRFRPDVDPSSAPLVFLGRLERCKGVHNAIAVARRLNRPLRIAGNVSDLPHERRYFETEIQPNIDGKLITYLGPVNNEQKNKLLGDPAALLMPIEFEEPFPIVLA